MHLWQGAAGCLAGQTMKEVALALGSSIIFHPRRLLKLRACETSPASRPRFSEAQNGEAQRRPKARKWKWALLQSTFPSQNVYNEFKWNEMELHVFSSSSIIRFFHLSMFSAFVKSDQEALVHAHVQMNLLFKVGLAVFAKRDLLKNLEKPWRTKNKTRGPLASHK